MRVMRCGMCGLGRWCGQVEPVDDRHAIEVAKREDQSCEVFAAAVVVERVDHDEHRRDAAKPLLLP